MAVKISVIIPTYKRPRLLINCLTALTTQQLPADDFEVLVVSDGKDPETAKAILLWTQKQTLQLKYVESPRKRGPAAARNLGWQLANAELVAFTDDDCLPQPGWLTAFCASYRKESVIAFAGKTIVPLPEKRTDFALNLAQLAHADFITANCCCTKSALHTVGGFDERFTMAWREDSDLQFKFIARGIKLEKIKEALVIHPVREAPWAISIKEQQKGLYDALLFKKHPELYRKHIQSAISDYYLILLFSILLLLAVYFDLHLPLIFSATILSLLFCRLILKRLNGRSKSPKQIIEMTFTSLLIPFLSVYWRIYGAIKHRVFFI